MLGGRQFTAESAKTVAFRIRSFGSAHTATYHRRLCCSYSKAPGLVVYSPGRRRLQQSRISGLQDLSRSHFPCLTRTHAKCLVTNLMCFLMLADGFGKEPRRRRK